MNGRGRFSQGERRGGRCPAFAWVPALLLALAGLVLAAATASAEEPLSWAGVWDTKWRGGGAQLELQQNGAEVTGQYPIYKGRIEAKAEGSQLTGRWIEGDRQGNFLFV